ncbi:orotidine-5'-phosphate decarboxylase [Myceligenerans crystallogenes]|uniref:Orotidine 5'-phosphate decarboxylase n=1 Tax=Myceligenerans crystallogenes TaxID=316335 RepID=A0ABN2N8P6_9MICO
MTSPGTPPAAPAQEQAPTQGTAFSFGTRFAAAMDEHGPLCVGIDPHAALLDAWGLPDTAAGVREFSLRVVEACGPHAAALKPQAAFYERHGSAGIAALEDTLAAARAAGVLTIVDAKRGDIGSTMAAYADAYLRDGSPLAGDALTVNPFLGLGSLDPAAELAADTGRGLFLLCLTSNKEGPDVQHARLARHGRRHDDPDGAQQVTVAAYIASYAAALNALSSPLGSVGLVVGATVGDAVAAAGVDLVAANAPILAPGVGAQGAGAAELAATFGEARGRVCASSSRSILAAGPDATALRAAACAAADDARHALRG